MISRYRALARRHLQETIPNRILRIQQLIDEETDPASLLYEGHLETPEYTHPVILQPTDSAVASLIPPGRKVISPDDTVYARGAEIVSVDEEVDKGEEGCNPRSGKMGVHWLEVVPGNKVQAELTNLVARWGDTDYRSNHPRGKG
jgi:hypothetical protein